MMNEHLKDLEVDADAHKEDKGLSENAVSGYITCMKHIQEEISLLKTKTIKDPDSSSCDILKDIVPPLVISVSAHTGRHYWTNSLSRKQAYILLTDVLVLCGCTSMCQLLIGIQEDNSVPVSPYTPLDDNDTIVKDIQVSPPTDKRDFTFKKGILKDVLLILKAKLQRSTWKSHPNSKHALIWCLKHLKHPNVEPFLDSFMPPLLMLIDDHETYHRALGLSGMTHLIRNCDVAVLRWYGRAEVIYEALKHLLYSNDCQVINSLHPCLMSLLPVLDGLSPVTVKAPRKPGKTDEVFDIFLGCMEMESKLAVRKAYSSHVSGYIEVLGIFTLRYLKRLLSIIFSYIANPDYCGEETRCNSLNTLIILMKHCWPRIPGHANDILKALLKLISDLSSDDGSDSNVKKQLPLITECLSVLLSCHPDIKSVYENILQELTGHEMVEQCVVQAMKNR